VLGIAQLAALVGMTLLCANFASAPRLARRIREPVP